mmetsp:Transcript_17895/g.29926  ORF Transcript_17895/g.29926 Transcript_17895/m.29926 type:complete len:121 (+) Transcript_17895:62-424(+)
MEGWLEKQGTVFKSWKRRFFVLYPDGDDKLFLRYYTNEDKMTEKGYFRIIIDSSVSGLDDGYGGGNRKCMFVLQAEGNKNKAVLLLSASSEEEKQGWIDAIQQGIDEIRQKIEASWEKQS